MTTASARRQRQRRLAYLLCPRRISGPAASPAARAMMACTMARHSSRQRQWIVSHALRHQRRRCASLAAPALPSLWSQRHTSQRQGRATQLRNSTPRPSKALLVSTRPRPAAITKTGWASPPRTPSTMARNFSTAAIRCRATLCTAPASMALAGSAVPQARDASACEASAGSGGRPVGCVVECVIRAGPAARCCGSQPPMTAFWLPHRQ